MRDRLRISTMKRADRPQPPPEAFGPTPPSEDSLGRSALREELVGELLTLHARILLRMPFFQLLLIGAIGWIALPDVSIQIFLAWVAFAIGAECLRALCAWWVLLRLPTQAPHHIHKLFMTLDALAGLSIGLAAVLFLRRVPLLSQMLLATTLFTVAAAGVSVAVSSKYMLAAYSSMVLLCAAASWGFLHPSQAPVVTVLTVAYWVFLIGISGDSERLLLRSLAIRRERDHALHALQSSNSEARAATARAEQSAQSRARVLAAASHDLRQPLHALSVYSAVLSANPGPQTLKEVGHNIDQLVRALGDMLSELLDLSRLSTGGYALQREPFALDKVVAEVCAEYGSIAADKQLALVCDLIPVQLVGDAGAVGRIARNLIDNAIKYTDHGHVWVSTSRVDTWAVLEVSDTGKGIDPPEQGRVFEEFYQIDNPGRDRSKGVGLGLSIVKRLCELIGAQVDLDSAPGQGSRFRVAFPGCGSGDVAASLPYSAKTAPAVWRGMQIYVVDDDKAVLDSMRALLPLWGLKVRDAASAHEADVLLAQWGRPDLLIADLRLQGTEDGATLATRLGDVHGHFPVLIMTGETAEPLLRKARNQGYTVLQKPVPAEALHAALMTLLQPA